VFHLCFDNLFACGINLCKLNSVDADGHGFRNDLINEYCLSDKQNQWIVFLISFELEPKRNTEHNVKHSWASSLCFV